MLWIISNLNLRPRIFHRQRYNHGVAESDTTEWLNIHPRCFRGKESACQCRRYWPGFDPWVGMIRWRRKWQPTPVLLPGESHGRRSLVGYSPKSHKESDTLSDCTYTEQLKIKQTWENVSSNSWKTWVIRLFTIGCHLKMILGWTQESTE